MQKEHNYGIDFLRIFLMFLIITGHLFVHTGIRNEIPIYSFKWTFTWFCESIIVCAVNCFVLITGYFSKTSSRFLSIRKIVLIYGQVLFYSVGIYLLLLITGNAEFSIKEAIYSLFPFASEQYWFFSSYILLLLLIPFLNHMLGSLNDLSLKMLTAIIVFIFYVLPIFQIVFITFDKSKGMGIIGFVTLYIIGHFLKRFDVKLSKLKCIIGIFINCLAIFASKIVFVYIVDKLEMNVGTSLLYNYNTIFQLINAVLLLLLFKDIKCSSSGIKKITIVSSSVFGIYLLHEHPNIRGILWNQRLSVMLLESSEISYLIFVLIIPIALFIVCFGIDLIRRLIGRLLSKTRFVKKIDTHLISLEKKINGKIND